MRSHRPVCLCSIALANIVTKITVGRKQRMLSTHAISGGTWSLRLKKRLSANLRSEPAQHQTATGDRNKG
jgi:hypothetical protein